jgi:hypothetical protein
MTRRRSGGPVFGFGPLYVCEGIFSLLWARGEGPGADGGALAVITARDLEVLDWLARVGAAEPGQVMARFGMGRTVAYRRLAVLCGASLVARTRLLHGRPGLLVATTVGLRAAGLSALGPARVSPASVAHWVASTHVALALEAAHGRGRVATVRELRLAESEVGRLIASARIGATKMHRPDLVVWGDSGVGRVGGVAVEVELSEKAPRRLEAILRAWRRATATGVVSGVHYYCSARVYGGVVRAVERTATVGQVSVARIDGLWTADVAVPMAVVGGQGFDGPAAVATNGRGRTS